MSLTGTLNTTLAGLQVTQQALQLVGSNVSNAQTPGYIRKTLNQIPVAAGNMIGVRVAAIDRSIDLIIQGQLRQESSGGGYADKLSELYKQLQTIYGEPGSDSSIDTLFSNFTTSLQTLGTSPNSSSAQSSAVNAAKLLAQQLNFMSNSIQQVRSAAEQGIAADIEKANSALQQIAKINMQISTATSIDPTTATLMDQRDKYIDDLAKLMDIRVVRGDFNQVNIYTGSGFQLVSTQAAVLKFNAQGTLTPNSLYNVDPTKSGVGTIMMVTPNGVPMDLIAAGAIKSGEIAAYLQMRDQILPQAQTQLDELAAQMSQAASDLTVAGTPVTVVPQTGFTVDTAALKTGNIIHLSYTDGTGTHNVSLVRVDDPSVLPLQNTATADPNDRVIGIDFSGGMAAVVTQLTIALGGTGMQFANPSGSVLRVLNDVANSVTVNSLSETTTLTSTASGSPQLPLFMDGSTSYSGAITASGLQRAGFAQRITVNGALLSNPSALVNYSAAPATQPGDSTRPDFLYNQMMTATFTYSTATGLGATAAPMQGTFTTYLGQVMTQQGQNAANAEALQEGQTVVVNSLQQRMSTISGVNVDSEMANLLTLQNAYAANARVFSTVQKMFETLLQM